MSARTTSVRRIVPLTFGWEHLPASVSLAGADPSVRLREPVPGVLLEVQGGWFLLDTGFNAPVLLDLQMRDDAGALPRSGPPRSRSTPPSRASTDRASTLTAVNTTDTAAIVGVKP